MATIPVSQLKPGDKLTENVLTKHNNILFSKGTTLSQRDMEILDAFCVFSVPVESKNGESDTSQTPPYQEKPAERISSSFVEKYDRMLQLLRIIFQASGSGGQALPTMEIRLALEGLIQHIEQYNVLTYSPRMYQLSDFVYHNSIMVSLTSYNLARWHGLPVKDWVPVALAGLLHDIGNAKVDRSLLFKPGKLNVDELEDVKKHTIIGYNILKGVASINEGVKLCALQHHEREDGSGYPLNIKGDKIHLYAKIVAITDMFHAMTSDRFHKTAKSPYLVLEQLLTESFGKLDPSIVQTFVSRVTALHNGVLVRLSDERVGEIVFSDRAHPTRPWVQINGSIVNLVNERNLYIKDVLTK